jgi:hypothetical protein
VLGCDTKEDKSPALNGNQLYASVEKYVSFGLHRSGHPGDYETSAWLEKELVASGYKVKYTEFPLNQFFLKNAFVQIRGNEKKFDAFPQWYLGEATPLSAEGILVSGRDTLLDVKNKIVLNEVGFAAEGQGTRTQIQKQIDAGARAVIVYKSNEANEIVAFNAPIHGEAWKAPVVVISPDDAKSLSARVGEVVELSITGHFEEVSVRNVYGTIGSGDEYVVVSTPISGWFTCGGERGPGVAIWLGLAKWIASQNFPYTFVFTGNSGHELGFWGAHEFLEKDAPPTEKTKLWIHLGAGAATLAWQSTSKGLVKQNVVDSARNFFYTSSVKEEFVKSFDKIPGKQWNTKERVGGELVNVLEKGYAAGLGISYSHPYFHTPNDDAATTSPEILEETANAFKLFIEETVKNKRN